MNKYLFLAVAIASLIVSISAILAQEAPLQGKPAESLQDIVKKKDVLAVKKAVDALVQQNNLLSLSALSNAIVSLGDSPDIEIYWTIMCGMAALTNEEVMSKTADFIVQHKDDKYGKSLLAAWRSNQSPLKPALLKGIKDKLSGEMLEECIRQLDNKLVKIIDKDAKSIRAYRDLKIVQGLDKDKIIVVRNDICDENIKKAGGKDAKGNQLFDGNFDRIQDVLTELGIPHTLIGKSELEKDTYLLADKWMLIFNCSYFRYHCCNPEHIKLYNPDIKRKDIRLLVCPGSEPHIIHSSKLSDKAIKKIKVFMESGGYLFTENWQIEEIIERAFKGTIASTKFLPEKTVKIAPYPGEVLHPYLKYVFEVPPVQIDLVDSTGMTKTLIPGTFYSEAQWKIDKQSPNIKVLKNDKVTILIASQELAKKEQNEGAVAVTFPVKRETDKSSQGEQVLHIMGRLAKFSVVQSMGYDKIDMTVGQKNIADEFTLQNLLVNFLEDCAARHQAQKPSKGE